MRAAQAKSPQRHKWQVLRPIYPFGLGERLLPPTSMQGLPRYRRRHKPQNYAQRSALAQEPTDRQMPPVPRPRGSAKEPKPPIATMPKRRNNRRFQAPQQGDKARSTVIPPAVYDGITAIKAKGLGRQPRARCRLEAFVFAEVKQMFHPFDGGRIKPFSNQFGY